jgi:hypothetical protein
VHYKVKNKCHVRGVNYVPGDIICEGDMPRDVLLPAIIQKDIEQIGEIDNSPYVEPPPPVVPAPTPEFPEGN